MLPAYLGYFIGTDADESRSTTASVRRGLVVGAVVSTGFLAVFGMAGLLLTLGLQSLTDIHLSRGYANNNADVGNRTNLYVFGSIAFLILLIASINFINLSTARSAEAMPSPT